MGKLWEFGLILILSAALSVTFLGAAETLFPGNREVLSQGETCILIDPGHGGSDGGAVGSCTGVVEAGLNLQVANYLREALEREGFRVLMTRQDENALAGTKSADMAARKNLIRGDYVDLVVSIHMNKFTDPTVSGPMAFYMQGSGEGQRLAQAVIDRVTQGVGRPRRLANPGDYFVLRVGSAPAVLVECGFLSNPKEEQQLQTDSYQQLLAQSIAEGILDYLNPAGALVPQETPPPSGAQESPLPAPTPGGGDPAGSVEAPANTPLPLGL